MDLETRPAIEPLQPRELGKDGQPSMPWGHEWLLAHTPHYTLKRLEMRKGASGPFQHHVNKFETFVVHSGRVMVTFLEDGEEASEIIGPGQGFTIPPGAPHRVEALAESVLYEASTPHFDDRVDDSHLLR